MAMIKLVLIFCFIVSYPLTLSAAWVPEHVVKDGECISKIAAKYCETVYGKSGALIEIRKLNASIKPWPNLKIGQLLLIPESCKEEEVHTVEVIPQKIDPIVEAIPARAPASIEENNDKWFVGIVGGYTNLFAKQSSGAKANLASGWQKGLTLGKTYYWDSQESQWSFKYVDEQYSAFVRQIDNPTPWRTQFQFQHLFVKNNNSFGFNFGFEQQSFISHSTTELIKIAVLPIGNAGLVYRWKSDEYKGKSLSFKSFANALSGAQIEDFKVRNGYSAGVEVSIEEKKHSVGFEVTQRNQSTSSHDHVAQRWLMKWTYKWGEEK
ncbi:MAG: hypothetical protein K2P81_16140 [Bacteriovoracaceae bacterium]|nr:hypothetical protein [Bacteriovoracaceae bacterium]